MQKLCDAKVFLNKNNLVFDLLYLARHTCQSLSEKKTIQDVQISYLNRMLYLRGMLRPVSRPLGVVSCSSFPHTNKNILQVYINKVDIWMSSLINFVGNRVLRGYGNS